MTNGIDTVVSEFESVAGFFSGSVSQFVFGEVSQLNENNSYPLILIDRGQTTSKVEKIFNTGLPRLKSYSVRLIIADDYGQAEQETVSLSDKFKQLEIIGQQYIAKMRSRGINNTSSLRVDAESLEQDYERNQFSEHLVTVGCTIRVLIDTSGCETGTFTDIERPTNLTAVVDGSNINISWQDNSDNETSFDLFRSTSPDSDFISLAQKDPDATSHVDSSASEGVIYFYKIRSFNADGVSGFSELASAMIPPSELSVDLSINSTTFLTGIAENTDIDVQYENGASVGSDVDGVWTIPNQNPLIDNIAYVRTRPPQTSSNRTGDSAWLKSNGYFEADDIEIYGIKPILVDFETLHSDTENIHSNTNRFTATDGTQTYSTNGIVQDHYSGMEFLFDSSFLDLGLATSGNSDSLGLDSFSNVDSAARSTSYQGGGWRLLTEDEWERIVRIDADSLADGKNPVGYAPFNLNSDYNYWSTSPSIGNSSFHYTLVGRTNAQYMNTTGVNSSAHVVICRWIPS